MPYQIAGIDMHKKMLAVVVADVQVDGEYRFEHRKVGTCPAQLRSLADRLVEESLARNGRDNTTALVIRAV